MSPHLLYSQAAPPYFLCINGDSYFYTKLKQMAFQLRRARKTHRAQALRLKRKKKIIIYTPGRKILNICDKHASVALNWIQTSNNCKCSSKLSLSPFLASSSFWWPQSFSSELLEASWRRKVPSPSDIFAAQENSDLGDREATQPQLHPKKGSLLCHGDTNQTFLPQEGSVFIILFLKILRFKFCSSS